MDEYDDDNNDFLDEQDRILAERIIKQSRGEQDNNLFNYAPDVQVEIDLTKVVPILKKESKQHKRTSSRPRRQAAPKKIVKELTYSSDSSSEEFIDDTVEEDEEEEDDVDELVSEDDKDDDFEIKEEAPKVVKKKSEFRMQTKSKSGVKRREADQRRVNTLPIVSRVSSIKMINCSNLKRNKKVNHQNQRN